MIMKEGCEALIAMGNLMNESLTALFISLNIWCVTMNVEKMSHWMKQARWSC